MCGMLPVAALEQLCPFRLPCVCVCERMCVNACVCVDAQMWGGTHGRTERAKERERRYWRYWRHDARTIIPPARARERRHLRASVSKVCLRCV